MGGTVQTAAGIAIAAVLGVATPASAIEPGPGASTGDDAFTIDMAAGEDPIGEVLGGNDTEVVGAARAWLLSEILLLAELDRFEASDLDPYLADVVGTAPLASPDRDRPDGPGGRLDSLAVVDTIGARLLSEMDRRGLAPSDAVRAALAPLPTVSTVDDPPDRATVSPDAHLWALTDLVLRQGAAPLDGRHLDDLDGTIEVLAEIRLDGPVTATEGWVDVIVASSPPPATLTGTGPEGSSTATAGRAAGTATVVAVVLVAAASAMALMLSLRRRSRTSRTPGVDSLTSLPDRRRLHSDLPGAVADPARSVALVRIEVDHFDDYVRRHGEAAGSEVIVRAARIISSSVREGDIVYRVAESEFSVLLSDTTTSDAVAAAGRIRRSVEAARFAGEWSQPRGRLTVSVGVALASGEEPRDARELRVGADRSLFRAQSAGHNLVVVSD